MPKVKQSFVWRFFVKNADGGLCKICNRDVKSGGKGGGTTNLKNHLKRNHMHNKEVKTALENEGDKAPYREETDNSIPATDSNIMQNFVSTPSTSTGTIIPYTVMDLSDLD